jgi:hypothetical protein
VNPLDIEVGVSSSILKKKSTACELERYISNTTKETKSQLLVVDLNLGISRGLLILSDAPSFEWA